jgi:hypothetical protein
LMRTNTPNNSSACSACSKSSSQSRSQPRFSEQRYVSNAWTPDADEVVAICRRGAQRQKIPILDLPLALATATRVGVDCRVSSLGPRRPVITQAVVDQNWSYSTNDLCRTLTHRTTKPCLLVRMVSCVGDSEVAPTRAGAQYETGGWDVGPRCSYRPLPYVTSNRIALYRPTISSIVRNNRNTSPIRLCIRAPRHSRARGRPA